MDAPLDQTVAALEGGLTGFTPAAAAGAIDGWMQALDGNVTLSGIRDDLGTLKETLAATPIDGAAVGALLVRLGYQTRQAASVGEPSVAATVARLGALLQNAGHALSGGAKPSPTSSNDF